MRGDDDCQVVIALSLPPSPLARPMGQLELESATKGLSERRQLLCLTLAAVSVGAWDRLEEAYHLILSFQIPPEDVLELLLQAHLFAGFPRTIEALDRWHRAIRHAPVEPPVREDLLSPEERRSRGQTLFQTIYAHTTERVLLQLELLGGPLRDWILEHAYGTVLTRPRLAAVERELAAVTALTVSSCPRQLGSHTRGALRCGARPEEVRAAIGLADRYVVRETVTKALAAFDESASGADGTS